jgi:hypothetical protein
MSENTVENILSQIVQLPPAEQAKLRQLWEQQGQSPQPPPAPSGHRVRPIPQPDYRPALRWLAEHAREYAKQWVALDGDRLIAHGSEARAVYAAAQADGAYLPLVTLVEDPDAPPYIGF